MTHEDLPKSGPSITVLESGLQRNLILCADAEKQFDARSLPSIRYRVSVGGLDPAALAGVRHFSILLTALVFPRSILRVHNSLKREI